MALKAIRKKIAVLISSIRNYLLRRFASVEIEQIVSTLEEVSSKHETAIVLVDDSVLGARLFKSLRKYIPRHLSTIHNKIVGMEFMSNIPAIIPRIVFGLYKEGRLKIYGDIRVRGITLKYIAKSLKTIRTMAAKLSVMAKIGQRMDHTLERILALHNYLDELKDRISDTDVKDILRRIDGEANIGMICNPKFAYFSRHEIAMKILAILKWMGER